MRTTLTLDPDVAADLKRQVEKTGRPFREVVNNALRRGLQAHATLEARTPYRLTPVSLGGVLPGIDLDRVLRLADTLEDEAVARELEMRK